MEDKRVGIRFSKGICRLSIRVKPNSQISKCLGFNLERQVLEVALNAQPRDGEANDALVDFIRNRTKIPKDKIAIVSGLKSRDKIVEIECHPDDLEKLFLQS